MIINNKDQSISSLLKRVTGLYPDQIAVKGDGYSYTYRQFYAAAVHFASQLEKAGVKAGEHVGMCLDRSAEMVVGIFGTLQRGAVYVPVDPSHPVERIRSVYEDAAVNCVVTTNEYVDLVTELGFVPVVPDIDISALADYYVDSVQPEDSAYILFTSGSTGKPKGVVIAHHSVVNLVEYIQDRYPIASGDVVLLKSPYTFDGSVWELFGWLLMGGTLCVANPGDEKDPARLVQLIEQEAISFLFFVPSMLSSFLDYYETVAHKQKLSSLKWISVGGEVLPVALVERFYSLLDGDRVKLINVYGPTETTVYATTYLCDPHEKYTKLPIGEAVDNDYIYILDENLNPVEPGQEGEICIGGAGVGAGYLNRPELTAEMFVPDTIRGSGTMYRTGDIGRQLENGLFDFVGRRDFQVKLRGLRIEVGEIEYALLQNSLIKECTVLFAKDRHGDDCLVAYLVPYQFADEASTQFILPDDEFVTNMNGTLCRYLPPYMIPSEWVLCRTFPLTDNGKVDRKALPPISALAQNRVDKQFVPQSDVDEKIYNIWKTVLGRNAIRDDEDFFAAGGHSLKAVQVITAVIRQLGCEIPLKEFYGGMTLSDMSRWVGNALPDAIPFSEYNVVSSGDRKEFPLTPAQNEMWVLHSLDSTGLTHNIQVEFTLKGDIDVDKWLDSLRQTIAREEIFRSTFPIGEGRPVQLIHDNCLFEIPYDDLSDYNSEEKELKYRALAQENGNKLFSLDQLPLFSFRLVRYSTTERRLLMAIHHIIFDGWSLQLFMSAWRMHYLDRVVDKPSYRSGDYAVWMNDNFSAEILSTELSYWQNALAGIPAKLMLPYKKKAIRAEAGKNGKRYWWTISDGLSEQLDALALASGVTPFVVFLSAYQLVLAEISGQRDIVVGTPFANRKHPMLEHLIGYYTNMVALRTRLTAKESLSELFSQCNENAIQAFSHACTPFGEIVKSLKFNAEKGVHPVYQAIFVMQNWPHNDGDFGAAEMTQREIGNDSCKIDLMLNAEKRDNLYELWLEYDCALFDEEFVNRLSAGINLTLDEYVRGSAELTTDDLLLKLESVVQPDLYRSCIVVGDGSLLMQCVETLQQKGFTVHSVVSSDITLIDWVKKLSLPFYTSLKDLSVFRPVDYIFSINNGFILKKEFTSLARRHAINYHDSPLPRYAGMYATNQAILNNEKSHAVSWHEVVDEIDAGDIFVQEKVVIKTGDSAFTLNSRCFEAAVRSFTLLLDKILAGNLTSYKQDLSKRTYYGLSDRTRSVGFIDWHNPVDNIRLMLRACNFGEHFDNEFLLPALLINGNVYFLSQSEPLKGNFENEGSVFRYKDQWAFGCLDGCVVIKQLYDTSGNEIDLDAFFVPGIRISRPENDYLNLLSDYFDRWIKYESFWKCRLRSSEFLTVPFVSDLMEDFVDNEWLRIPTSLVERIKKQCPECSFLEIVTVFAASFMLRLSGKSEGTIGLVPPGLGLIAKESNHYWSGWLPYTISLDAEKSLAQLFKERIGLVKLLQKKGTFTSNLRLRYPSLKSEAELTPFIYVINKGEELIIPDEKANYVIFEVSDNAVRIKGLSRQVVDSFISVIIHILTSSDHKSGDLAIYSSPLQSLYQEKLCEPVCMPVVFDNVITQFDTISSQFGDRLALFDQGISLSYTQFRREVLLMTAELRKNGINEGNVVAINLGRGNLYFVSLMAALGCGACFVPIDPTLPVDRQVYIAQDSGADIVLHEGNVIWTDFKSIDVIRSIQIIRDSERVPDITLYKPSEKDLAYIIYTSGSSGKPKGVKISHGALANFISGALGLYNITCEDRILQFSNLGFDASIEEIFSAFCSGASLYLRNEKMLSPLDLMQFSVENKITIWDLPTAFWRQVISISETEGQFAENSLRLVIIGGEAVTLADFDVWKNSKPAHRLFNTYGPTETTVVALAHELKSSDVYTSVGVPIGKPLPGYTIQIVDLYNQPLPSGVIGELQIAGRSIADGYVRADKKQSEVFGQITDMRGCVLKAYKTGDLVVADANGVVYYMGRRDAQVKIRGFRIEPGEIETNIRRLEEVEDCAVVAFAKKSGEKSLAAFITSTSKSEPDYGLIKEKLFALMPSYMVPEIIESVESVPLTFNGKVDKIKLQLKAERLSAAKSGFAEDSVEFISMLNSFAETLEQEPAVKEISVYLLELVRKLADDHTIMPGDDLMYSGFDSLKFIRLIVALEKDYGVRISISDIYNNHTINKLSNLIAEYKPQPTSNSIVCLRKGKTGEVPLFLIWGAGQYVFEFNDLLTRLNEDTPVYVLQAPIVEGVVRIPDTVEELSAHYIAEIEKVISTKSIFLAGYSFGGFMVYEMAKQLSVSDRLRVEKLLILDTSAHFVQYRGQYKWHYSTVVGRAKMWWFITRNPINQYRTIKKTIEEKLLIHRIKKQMKAEVEAGVREQLELEFNDFLHAWAAVRIKMYIMEKANVHICLLTSESHLKFGGLYLGWKKYATLGVDPYYVHAFHADLFLEENIDQLAGWINSHILSAK